MSRNPAKKATRKTARAKPVRKTAAKRSSTTGRLASRRGRTSSKSEISPSAIRLKALRKESGLSIREMAKALEMSPTSYQHYEDRYKRPFLPYELIGPIKDILRKNGVSRTAAEELSPPISNLSDEVVNITYAPLISWVQAGELNEVVDPYELGEAESEVAIEYDRDSVLALRVRGSSINRVAPDGAIVIVDYSQQELRSDKFYVIRREGEATVKRFMRRPNRFEPYSTEKGHPTFKPSKDLTIVGRVVRVVTEL